MNSKTALNSLWMLVAGFFFAVMGVCVKLGSVTFSSAELVFYRSLFGFIAIFALTFTQSMPLKTPHLFMHISRSMNGFIALMLFFYAISHLPLATAVTLNYTSPIFLAIFTTILLKEKIQPMLMVTIVLGFIGVYLLLNPTLHWQVLSASGPGLISGLLSGFVYMQVTQLGRYGEPPWRIVFYFTLVSMICSGLWVMATGFNPLSLHDLPLLLGLGLSATAAQLAMTRAYGKGDPLTVGSLAYSTVIFASLFDVVLWQENLSLVNWIAIALIVFSGILSVKWTARKATIAAP